MSVVFALIKIPTQVVDGSGKAVGTTTKDHTKGFDLVDNTLEDIRAWAAGLNGAACTLMFETPAGESK